MITHSEARIIAQKFIDRVFANPDREYPRFSIPVNHERDDDVRLMEYIAQEEALMTLRPAAEWHEDYGACIWYHLPLQEPPYIGTPEEWNRDGSPTACAAQIASGWLTHFSRLPDARLLTISDGVANEAR